MSFIRAVLFDIGGVIIRTDNPGPRQRLGERFGLDRDAMDALVFGCPASQAAELGLETEAAVWSSVKLALGLSDEELSEFKREFWAGDSLDRSLVDLAASLRPGLKTGLLTNAWNPSPLSIFTLQHGLPDALAQAAYDVVISSAAVGVKKPDRRIFEIAVERLGVQFSETAFIDDNAANIAAAKRLGMHAIRFREPTQAIKALRKLLNG
jgi:HAD superfamily hydrolase (TIGR01509 family)